MTKKQNNPSIVKPNKRRWPAAAAAAALIVGGAGAVASSQRGPGEQPAPNKKATALDVPQTTVPPTVPGLVLSERPSARAEGLVGASEEAGDSAEEALIRAAGSTVSDITGSKNPYATEEPLDTVPPTTPEKPTDSRPHTETVAPTTQPN